MDNAGVAYAAIGLTGAMLAIVVKPLFSLLKESTKASRDQTKAIVGLTKETKKGNEEAKQRNGHLGEQSIQIIKAVGEISKNLNTQNVADQVVEHQHVKEVTKE